MNGNYRIRFKNGELEFEVEGDKEFVKELFEEFKVDTKILIESQERSLKPINNQEGQFQPIHEKYTLQRLYKLISPKTNLDRIIIFAYWILKAENVEEFSVNDILKYFDQFRIKKPANISRDFSKLINPSKGYLISGKKEGFFCLSYDGVQYFEGKVETLENKL